MRLSSRRLNTNQENSLVAFLVGDVRYAVPIGVVREIVLPMPLTILPHTPDGLAGVADHRNEVLPIVDLRMRFGVPPASAASRKTKWILVTVEGRTFGLVVDDVLGVLRVSMEDFRPPPDLGAGARARAIASVTAQDKLLVFVLDLAVLETTASMAPDSKRLEADSRPSRMEDA